MTSTPFNVGLGDGSRSSSRVLRPPGGGHTDIFGGGMLPLRGRRMVPEPGSTQNHNTNDNMIVNSAMAEKMPQNQNGASVEPIIPDSATSAAVNHAKEEKRVVDEKEKNAESKVNTESAKAEAPKRVRVPPGGFSSSFW